ncbi:MAG: hypothetical protein ACRD3E_19530 [Terriglobales bacterium]
MTPNLKKAHAAPRCQFTRLNDQPCTQPALNGGPFCRFHDLIVEPPADSRIIPFVEDATTLQTALMQVIRSLQLGKLDRRTAGTILYALQIAASNLKYLAAETGRPYPNLSAKPTRKQDEDDDIPGPSLAEILLDRLRALEEEPDEDASAVRNAGVSPAAPGSDRGNSISAMTQNVAAPESRSDASLVAQDEVLGTSETSFPSPVGTDRPSRSAPPRPPASPAVNSAILDKLHACESKIKNRKSKMSFLAPRPSLLVPAARMKNIPVRTT